MIAPSVSIFTICVILPHNLFALYYRRAIFSSHDLQYFLIHYPIILSHPISLIHQILLPKICHNLITLFECFLEAQAKI